MSDLSGWEESLDEAIFFQSRSMTQLNMHWGLFTLHPVAALWTSFWNGIKAHHRFISTSYRGLTHSARSNLQTGSSVSLLVTQICSQFVLTWWIIMCKAVWRSQQLSQYFHWRTCQNTLCEGCHLWRQIWVLITHCCTSLCIYFEFMRAEKD